MNVKWYIEKEFFWEGQPDTILSVLDKLQVPYHLQKFNVNGLDYSYDMFHKDDCVLAYGSIEFIRKVNRECPWTPGASWCDTKNLSCLSYYSHYGDYLLNREYMFIPLAEFRRLKHFIFDKFGIDNKVFIRPDSPYKEFTGFVVHKEEFDTRIKTMSYGDLEPTLMMVVAKPKVIESEYRFYVTRGEVIAGSRYKLNNEHDEDPNYPIEAYNLALEISKVEWSPAPVFVVDIGKIDNGDYKLLEINSFNCSGMYYCDLEKIVTKSNEVALKCWEGVN